VRPIKKILQNDLLRRFVCRLAAAYIRLVWLTGRWRTVRGEVAEEFWKSGKPFILAFWHGRLMMMPYSWNRRVPIHMLISQHRDGLIISHTVRHFGIKTVAGSSGRGGVGALRAMLKALKSDECIGITPDGPRGPRMRAGDGVATLARLAGVPVIAASVGARRRRTLSSWDRFMVALPFGGGVIVWGKPIEVAKDADDTALEAARRQVEESLNALTKEADLLSGQKTFIGPEEPEEPEETTGGETL
jgi:lysophospholipid acyltransferase (LPLAT)-like uncharacterized protein